MSFKKVVVYPTDRSEDNIDNEIKKVLISQLPREEKLLAYKRIVQTAEQKLEPPKPKFKWTKF